VFPPGGAAAKGGVHLIVPHDELQKGPGISARRRRSLALWPKRMNPVSDGGLLLGHGPTYEGVLLWVGPWPNIGSVNLDGEIIRLIQCITKSNAAASKFQ